MVQLEWGAATDVGNVRARNEDHLFARTPLFVVADGMGGRPGGMLASRIAVDALASFADQPPPRQEDVLAAVGRAHDAVVAAGCDYAGMGTTLAGLALVHDGGAEYWLGFNVGDSRLYRFADGALEQLSQDHSEVQELIDAGAIIADERSGHPSRNVLTRALGIGADTPEVDCWLLCPVRGERFLLCSDGLTGELTDGDIATVLGAEPGTDAAARRLVADARAAGGRDNISAVVVQVNGE